MFDEVTRAERWRRSTRRAGYLAGSALALAAVALLAIHLVGGSADVTDRSLVAVKIIGATPSDEEAASISNPRAAAQAPRPRPRPQAEKPGLTGAAAASRREVPSRVERQEKPAEERASTGTAAGTATPTATDRPTYAQARASTGAGSGTGSGVGSETGDLPAFPEAGWRRPEQAARGCVQESVRIPHDLRGFVSGPVVVRFAVGRDGAPSAFEVLGAIPDARLGGAIWQAIRSCRWIPGADAQGRPMKIWVIMPMRFVSG